MLKKKKPGVFSEEMSSLCFDVLTISKINTAWDFKLRLVAWIVIFFTDWHTCRTTFSPLFEMCGFI